MATVSTPSEVPGVIIEIGGLPVRLRVADPEFIALLRKRYAGFVTTTSEPRFEFDIDLQPPGMEYQDQEVEVVFDAGKWSFARGDFHAEWNPAAGCGRIRQTANPYSIDAVMRILHTLLLAREGGFLLHASSASVGGRAVLFAGVSGAGKTTMARLAPPSATLLTDEVSYVRKLPEGYFAYGTPFVGELNTPGENVKVPVGVLYLLKQGPVNQIETVPEQVAIRALLESILFFARDPELVKLVFETAAEFVRRIPVRRLTFLPDARVWEMVVED
ncbi:MAG: hypothetical protein WB869_19075, partial [Candidatus Acidiferrales bacterium]